MGKAMPSVEPTIWALRKNGLRVEQNDSDISSLYEHLYGYDPIRLTSMPAKMQNSQEHSIRRGSAENPGLNIINPMTNFAVMEIAADLPPENN
jgi:hypothetical protein